ncbi:sulfotransferase family 2 domain-containing protein [Faunimonas sp. B44]
MHAQIAFLHIPKTAGTSVRAALVRAYGRNEVVFIQPQNAPDDLSTYRVVGGHFNAAFIKSRIPDAEVVTILRDPTNRVLSLYRYWTARQIPWVTRLTLEQFAETSHPGCIRHIDNSQAWQIANSELPRDRRKMAGTSDDELFAMAVTNLEKCAVVGTTERLSEFSRAMHVRFRIPFHIPHLNASQSGGGSSQISECAREAIERRTAVDRRLYDYVVARERY